MPNPGQPTIAPGATGDVVRRVQRALRRTPDLGLAVDGVFGPNTETAVRDFQGGAGLVVDGIVGPATWAALPDGSPMPTLKDGSTGDVVRSLQRVLTNGASGQWNTTPGAIDGIFGPNTKASVEAFQTWGGVSADGVVGDQTWAVSLHAASATLETAVGLQYVVRRHRPEIHDASSAAIKLVLGCGFNQHFAFLQFDQLVDTMRGCQHAAWSDRLLRRGRIGRMQCLRISGPGIAGSWTLRSFAKWDRNLSSFAE